MIPPVSIADLILAFICFGITLQLLRDHKGSKAQLIHYFIFFYIFFGISFFFFSIPELFSKDATVITVFNILSYFSFYLALAYIAQVPFSLLGRSGMATAMFYISFIFGLFFLVMRFLTFQLSEAQVMGQFIYWKPIYAGWLRSATGVFSGLIAIITMIVFFTQGVKHRQNHLIFVRSMWLGTGLLFLLFSSLSTYALNPGATFTPVIVSTILAIIGFLCIFVGVRFKAEHDETENPPAESDV